MSVIPDSPVVSDVEKQGAARTGNTTKALIDELGDNGAHLLDARLLNGENIQTTSDGKTILIPQPSSDPKDPLNWSKLKKYIILFVISVVGFMPDFVSSNGIVTLLPQTVYVHSVCRRVSRALSCQLC